MSLSISPLSVQVIGPRYNHNSEGKARHVFKNKIKPCGVIEVWDIS